MKSYDRLLRLANKFVRKIASERGYGFGNSLKFAQKEENFIDYSADFDGAFDSYIKTMLWYSEPTGQGENSDETFGSLGYSEKDLSEEARQQSKNDLKKFIALAVYRGVDLPKV